MFLLWGHVGEDDAASFDAILCRKLVQVCFASSWEPKQPEDSLWDSLEDIQPAPHCGWLNLVELVKVAEYNSTLREPVLCPCGEREVVQQWSSALLAVVVVVGLMGGWRLCGWRRWDHDHLLGIAHHTGLVLLLELHLLLLELLLLELVEELLRNDLLLLKGKVLDVRHLACSLLLVHLGHLCTLDGEGERGVW